jgi:DNA-nicking Smr family endonuclease
MRRRGVSEEERALWHSVAKTAQPLKRRRRSEPKAAVVAPLAKSASKTTKPRAKPAPPTPPPAPKAARPPHALAHGIAIGIDKRQADRFRGGRLPIEGRIDLHGRTQQQAHDALHDFLARAFAADKRCVLVITGKGMTASKPGVLKENVPRWLNEPALRRSVLAFDYAEPQHGGEGALYVLLKRKREGER